MASGRLRALGLAIVEMPAEYAADGKTFDHPIRVLFELDLKNHSGKFIGAFEKQKNSTGAVKIDEGLIRPYKVAVVEKGDYTYSPGADAFKGKLSIRSVTLPEKKYMVGVHLTDFAGNMSTKLVDVAALVTLLKGKVLKPTPMSCAKKMGCAVAPDDSSSTWLSPWTGLGAVAALTIGRRRLRASKR